MRGFHHVKCHQRADHVGKQQKNDRGLEKTHHLHGQFPQRASSPFRRQYQRGTEVPAPRCRGTNSTGARVMLKSTSLSAVVLLAGVSLAMEQQNANDPGQQAPANPQGDGVFKSQQNAKEEPGSHSSGQPTSTAVFVDGKLAVPGAPADSQTVPSKVSERNAKLDATPIMAMPLPLSDEQKQRIVASIAKSNAPVREISAKPADMLPVTTEVSDFPAEVKQDAPILSDIQFIRTKDKILLVRAPSMVVTGELATQ